MWSVRCCVLVYLIGSLLQCNAGSKASKSTDKTLKQVHVLFRHGDRAPIRPYLKDPNNSEDNWPYGWAQLTKEGMQQHQRLGRWFRSRYDSLLSRHWVAAEIEVLSTAVDRTINSVQANLQGLYSSTEDSRWYDASLHWIPVPVRSYPPAYDQILNIDACCPRIHEASEEVMEEPEVKAYTEKCEPLFELLTEKLGDNINSIVDVDFAYDNFRIQEIHNITIPEWALEQMDTMKEVSFFSFDLLAYTDELKMLRSGPLLAKILTAMERKSHNASNSGPNFLIYSAHDTTVASNLEALGVYNHIAPPYAAAVIYELHEKGGQYFVQLLYRNDTVAEGGDAVPLTLPGCSSLCPLAQFRSLLQTLLPTNYTQQCKRKTPEDGSIVPEIRTVLTLNETVCLLLLLGVFLMLLLMTTMLILWRKRDIRMKDYSLLAQSSCS